MVVYILSITADLEGVDSITLKPNADICLSVRNPLDHNEIREKIVVDRRDFEEDPLADIDARGAPRRNSKHHHPKHAEAPCHFALKWDGGATERSTIRVLDPNDEQLLRGSFRKSKKKNHAAAAAQSNESSLIASKMSAGDSGTAVRMLALECQGIEPYAFHLMGNELEIQNKSGTVFQDDLTWSETGDWSTFDTFVGGTSVKNLKGEFE